MRDLIVALIVFGSIPFILKRPYLGILVWSWLSYMNPHRLAWGFAYDFPFAQTVAIATLIAMIMSSEPKRVPITRVTVLWALFFVWTAITTIFAVQPYAVEELSRALKIQLVTVWTLILMRSKQRIDLLIWVIVGSLAFFGVKGGIFTLLSGGSNRVYGPYDSYIEDNNALALAILMSIPLVFYLRKQVKNRWLRHALLGVGILMAVSAIGSQSRGALLGASATAMLFWWRSNRKIITGAITAALVAGVLAFMPQSWYDRMDTIRTYESDGSAMGRIYAWEMAFHAANDRLFGGGFAFWSPAMYQQYSPEELTWTTSKAAHSIYFGVLGEHGWIGLILFVSVLVGSWLNAGWLIRHTDKHPEIGWMADLARSIQVGLLAYLVGGAFLSLSYFDLPWHLIGLLVICRDLATRQFAESAKKRSPAPRGVPPPVIRRDQEERPKA